MQAIRTKFLPPGYSRGSRIKATCARGSITIGYHSGPVGMDIHEYAAEALCEKFVEEDRMQYGEEAAKKSPWNLNRITGELSDGVKVHVLTNR